MHFLIALEKVEEGGIWEGNKEMSLPIQPFHPPLSIQKQHKFSQ